MHQALILSIFLTFLIHSSVWNLAPDFPGFCFASLSDILRSQKLQWNFPPIQVYSSSRDVFSVARIYLSNVFAYLIRVVKACGVQIQISPWSLGSACQPIVGAVTSYQAATPDALPGDNWASLEEFLTTTGWFCWLVMWNILEYGKLLLIWWISNWSLDSHVPGPEENKLEYQL